PLLYSRYASDSISTSNSNTLVKFANDTVVVGLIINDERTYLGEVENVTAWCQANNLCLNVAKNKEMIVDFGRNQMRKYSPLKINGTPVERVNLFKYLGVHLTEDLSWTVDTNILVTKAR
ncbi:hypothetical protein LDENG_00005690, partial [Lucifuga dentata]